MTHKFSRNLKLEHLILLDSQFCYLQVTTNWDNTGHSHSGATIRKVAKSESESKLREAKVEIQGKLMCDSDRRAYEMGKWLFWLLVMCAFEFLSSCTGFHKMYFYPFKEICFFQGSVSGFVLKQIIFNLLSYIQSEK